MRTIVKQLRQLRSPAARSRTGTFYIEGLRIVQQALQARVTIELVVTAPELFATPTSLDVVAALQAADVLVVELSAAEFTTISFKDPRHGIGAVFAVRLVRTTFSEFAAWAHGHRYTVVGTSPFVAAAYRDVVYSTPMILLMGSERTGLSGAQQAACTLLTRIPMAGTGDSLNVAVATSVVLYEVYHQHRRHMATMREPAAGSSEHAGT